jgi:hypothetical protein
VLCLVVPAFAYINILVWRKPSWSTFVVTREEHDKAAVDNLIDWVVAVLARLEDFVVEEMSIKPMHCLLRAIVPASIDPFSTIGILPRSIYLSNDGLCQVVGVLNVNPVP